MSVQLRFVLAVEMPDGEVKLLELRERHTQAIEALNSHERGQVGAVIRVFKLWRQQNAPIEIELIERRAVVPIELSRLVKQLGLPALRLSEDPPQRE